MCTDHHPHMPETNLPVSAVIGSDGPREQKRGILSRE